MEFDTVIKSLSVDIVIGKKFTYPLAKILDDGIFKKGNPHLSVKGRKPNQNTIDKIYKCFELVQKMKIKNNLSTNKKGLYCFVASSDFSLSLFDLFAPFLFVGKDGNYKLIGTSKINTFPGESFSNWDEQIDFKKGEVVYVGSSENLHNRVMAHLSSGSDLPNSLKLGERQILKENVLLYSLECEDANKLESFIRNYYGSRFGK